MKKSKVRSVAVALDLTKIRTLRTKRGWSFDTAAEQAGLASRNVWYMVESGRRPDPAFSTVEKIAKALGVSVDALTVKPSPK